MTRRTIPRDAVLRHLAVCEATRETLRAVLDAPFDAGSSAVLCLGLLERLEVSENGLRQAVEGKADAPLAPETKKRRKVDNGDGPAKSAGIAMPARDLASGAADGETD
jgi:hypothetical protein